MAIAKVTLEIKRGRGDRAKYLYATIRYAEDMPIFGNKKGDVAVNADLEYCLECLKSKMPERYELVNGVEAIEDLNTILRGMM